MKNYLFLDDVRMPADVFRYTHNKLYLETQWEIVRNYKEFVDWINNNGIPYLISFDHDLAPEHYPNYTSSPSYVHTDHIEPNGHDCSKFLVERLLETKETPPIIMVHSMNPVGSSNILNTWKSFYSYYESL